MFRCWGLQCCHRVATDCQVARSRDYSAVCSASSGRPLRLSCPASLMMNQWSEECWIPWLCFDKWSSWTPAGSWHHSWRCELFSSASEKLISQTLLPRAVEAWPGGRNIGKNIALRSIEIERENRNNKQNKTWRFMSLFSRSNSLNKKKW